MDLKRPTPKHRRTAPPGAPPGTLVALPDGQKPVIRVMAYGPDSLVEETVAEVGAIPEYIGKWPVTWINVDGLGDIDLLQWFGDHFSLHRLALEDVLDVHQRAKVEDYGDQLFMVMRMLEGGRRVSTEQISLFLGEGFVITLQEHPGDCLDPVRERIRHSRGRIRSMGADYLAYALLDAVIDGYFPHLDDFSDVVEAMEEEVLARPKPATVGRIHQLKRDLLAIRRALAPLREAINVMLRDECPAVSDATRVYLRDCYDHIIQILEMVETYRELVGGLLDVYLTSVSNRMNEVMKVLTIIATVFIPLSFLAGLYGMNFDGAASPWNMPELRWYWGYPAFLVLVVVVAVAELVVFWRKGWLGSGTEHVKPKSKDKD